MSALPGRAGSPMGRAARPERSRLPWRASRPWHLAVALVTVTVAVAVAVADGSARGASVPHATPSRPVVIASRTVRIVGSLWVDCRRDGRRTASDPPIRGTVVELVTTDGQLSTTLTGAHGEYEFTVRAGAPVAVEVPLIQRALNGYLPSPTAGSRPRAGRSIGRRVADLDRAPISDLTQGTEPARYDFGFISRAAKGAACQETRRTARSSSPSDSI